MKYLNYLVVLALFLLGSCNEYGSRIDFNNFEIYYKDDVSKEEVWQVAEVLIEKKIFKDSEVKVSVQLRKENGVYQFRMVAKEGMENEEESVEAAQDLLKILKEEVFPNDEVEFHFCNNRLQTMRVIQRKKDGYNTHTKNDNTTSYTQRKSQNKEASLEDQEKLEAYLQKEGFYEGGEKRVRLDKEDGVYQFKMVLDPAFWADPYFEESAKKSIRTISQEVFDGQPTAFHYCNEAFETIRVIGLKEKEPSAYGKEIDFYHGELYYTENVTRAEAIQLGVYLVTNKYFSGRAVSVQLDKKANTYQLRVVTQKGYENKESYINYLETLGKDVSIKLFGGVPLEVHICDTYFNTVKVLTINL